MLALLMPQPVPVQHLFVDPVRCSLESIYDRHVALHNPLVSNQNVEKYMRIVSASLQALVASQFNRSSIALLTIRLILLSIVIHEYDIR